MDLPEKTKRKIHKLPTIVSVILLVVLFGMPWIRVHGNPLFMFNILERKFILFGSYFPPQDFHLFVLAMIIMVIFIALFTVIYGRIFCGWICPQTIFMESVYRKIEYWIEGDSNAQRRLNNAPWTASKFIKKFSKQVIFFSIAVLVANTFLSYIIGTDQVLAIVKDPISKHTQGFLAMIAFSFAFYGVFAFLREQVCTTICPYGRLQGVLLDKNSVVITYDYLRGEPRGKIHKAVKGKEEEAAKMNALLGDCIDCKMCIQVCPTGIDIRNGTQLECVNCTACIDACDEVMTKVNRPTGLIRYDSEEGIRTGAKKIMTPRAIAYTSVLGVLVLLEIILFATRTQVEGLLLRTPGMLYQKTDDGYISNLYNYQFVNKTSDTLALEMELIGIDGRIKWVGHAPIAIPNDVTEGAVFVELPPSELQTGKNKITLRVRSGDRTVDQVKTSFLAP